MTLAHELATLLRSRLEDHGLRKYGPVLRSLERLLSQAGAQVSQALRPAVAALGVAGRAAWGGRGAQRQAGTQVSQATLRPAVAALGLAGRAAWGSGGADAIGLAGVPAACASSMARLAKGLHRLRPGRTAPLARAQPYALPGLRGTVGATPALAVFQRIAADTGAWAQLEARMRRAVSSAREYAQVDHHLARVSRMTRRSYADNAEVFLRTRHALASLGATTQDTVAATESLALGMALSGTKTRDQETVIHSLVNVIRQGKLGLEEYETLMQAAPRLQRALADALGVTTLKLQEMVKAGEITGAALLPSLQTQLSKMRAEAQDLPISFSEALTLCDDAFRRFVGTLPLGRVAVRGLTKALVAMADNIGPVVKLLTLVGSAWGLMKLQSWIALATLQSGGLARSLRIAARTALGLDNAMALRRGPAGALRLLSLWRLTLVPLLRMAAVLSSLYVIGADITAWMQGGASFIGAWIGPVEAWSAEIERVRQTLEFITGSLGGASDQLGPWITQWGSILMLVYGVWTMLSPVRRLLVLLATRVVPLLWAAFAAHPLVGIITLVLAGLLAIWRNWAVIRHAFGTAWDWMAAKGMEALNALRGGFGELADGMMEKIRAVGTAIKAWILDKADAAGRGLKSLLPDWMSDASTDGAAATVNDWLRKNAPWTQAIMGSADFVPKVPAASAQRAGTPTGRGPLTIQHHNEINVTARDSDPHVIAGAASRGVDAAQQRGTDAISQLFGFPTGVEVPT